MSETRWVIFSDSGAGNKGYEESGEGEGKERGIREIPQ
jgi:hypothetical protein